MTDIELTHLIADCLNSLGLDKFDKASVNADTSLFGADGLLDSIDLVNFIADLEFSLQERFGIEVVLASDKAMGRKSSPFLRVGTLVEYVNETRA